MSLEQRLERIESLLVALVRREQKKDWYSVEEFARLVGRSPFTCREWCRLGRIEASKKASGRGAFAAWAISHAELLRFQREGLRQVSRNSST
ncbi:MAG: helix-turn-helix domain-containing protein [Planctomyces sp.]|nr:helix-turn-helix domain-containing protein [Planctomyces sp.]